ncbi:MFS transporter [Ramlibacter sp.]|uniref:MFS transporter n=1 Tax=Ramlibacter sp. TaxID=1917967 RepID=UPI002CB607B8|nr:MFS transporter [Ramlibacter sp.]HWI84573.1 MFS transporter [Ramlibacter sp.]
MRKIDPALLVFLGGIAAALHVGKLPPALPALAQSLGVTLIQAGFLLSLVQLAGMTLGLAAGLVADSLGLKRTMVAGLVLLSTAGVLGGWAGNPSALMALRAAEGLGFLLASMPAPSLIRRLVEPARMSAALGLWGAYMPFGTALALLLGPLVIAGTGWPGWWWLLAGFSGAVAWWLCRVLPADVPHRPAADGAAAGWRQRLRRTLTARGPWLVALSFAAYSSQWLAVIGFLPTMYAQAGVGPALAGAATALAAAVNVTGNIASGRLLQRGVRPHVLLHLGFAAMGAAAFVAFAPVWGEPGPRAAAALRYAAVLVFSAVGGLIPGTLFSLAVRLAPGEGTVSTTVGWMQQCSSLGQFCGPPLVALVAARAGGWQWSWVVTGGCAAAGVALSTLIGSAVSRPLAAPNRLGQRT